MRMRATVSHEHAGSTMQVVLVKDEGEKEKMADFQKVRCEQRTQRCCRNFSKIINEAQQVNNRWR